MTTYADQLASVQAMTTNVGLDHPRLLTAPDLDALRAVLADYELCKRVAEAALALSLIPDFEVRTRNQAGASEAHGELLAALDAWVAKDKASA